MKKILSILILFLLSMTLVSAKEITEPGIYEIEPNDLISLNDITKKVLDIKLDDISDPWNSNFNKPMVYVAGGDIATRIYEGKIERLRENKFAPKDRMAIKVISIDVVEKKATVEIIDLDAPETKIVKKGFFSKILNWVKSLFS